MHPLYALKHHTFLDPTMSSDLSNNQSLLRNRKPPPPTEGPPVPPKLNAQPSLSQRRGIGPLDPPKQLKPLPPVPQSDVPGSKPLPRPPQRVKLGATVLWIGAFAVWFLLIVAMLPVVMERDAMIGLNAWLWAWWS
jgi:hypothetical protein